MPSCNNIKGFLTASALLFAGTVATVGISKCSVQREKERIQLDDSKRFIQHADPFLYDVLEARGENRLQVWSNAAKSCLLDQHIEARCKRAYFEGAQMVRDSIAKANLNDTVKTIIKSVK